MAFWLSHATQWTHFFRIHNWPRTPRRRKGQFIGNLSLFVVVRYYRSSLRTMSKKKTKTNATTNPNGAMITMHDIWQGWLLFLFLSIILDGSDSGRLVVVCVVFCCVLVLLSYFSCFYHCGCWWRPCAVRRNGFSDRSIDCCRCFNKKKSLVIVKQQKIKSRFCCLLLIFSGLRQSLVFVAHNARSLRHVAKRTKKSHIGRIILRTCLTCIDGHLAT